MIIDGACRFGEGEGKVWLEKVECLDSHRQSHLLRCTHQHSQLSPEYNHSMDLALQCSELFSFYLFLFVCLFRYHTSVGQALRGFCEDR